MAKNGVFSPLEARSVKNPEGARKTGYTHLSYTEMSGLSQQKKPDIGLQARFEL